MSDLSEKIFVGAVCATALTVVGVTGMWFVNGIQSGAEFNGAQAQVRAKIEEGCFTAPEGTPRPCTITYNGNEFSAVVRSALNTTDGTFYQGSGSGQVSASETQSSALADGVRSSQVFQTSYEVKGTLYRQSGPRGLLRIFFNDGGSRDFSYTWNGAAPKGAPLSPQRVTVPVVVELPLGATRQVTPEAPQ